MPMVVHSTMRKDMMYLEAERTYLDKESRCQEEAEMRHLQLDYDWVMRELARWEMYNTT